MRALLLLALGCGLAGAPSTKAPATGFKGEAVGTIILPDGGVEPVTTMSSRVFNWSPRFPIAKSLSTYAGRVFDIEAYEDGGIRVWNIEPGAVTVELPDGGTCR